MKEQQELKDSEIEFVGKIPTDWKVLPLKFFSSITLGKMLTPEDKGGNIKKKYLRSQNIQINSVDTDDIKEMWFSDSDLTKYRLNSGDILVNEGGDIGRTCMWNDELEECYIQNSVNRVTILSGHNKYYLFHFYLYHQTGYFDSLVNRVSIPHLTKEKLENIKFVVPPLSKQIVISKFLDYKITQIDKLIADKEKLIAFLNEERVVSINQAVTKGINYPVPMKDSDIKWLGNIPEHWERLQIKRVVLTKVCDGPHETPLWVEDGVPFVSAEAVKGGKIDFNYKRGYITIEQHTEYSKKAKATFGDILFCKSGSTTGKSAIVEVDIDFGIWSPLAIIRANPKLINNYFLFQTIQSDMFQRQVETAWTFGTQPNIGMGALENLWVTLPPKSEQLEIVRYIENQINSFNNVTTKIQSEVAFLKEYKIALISEVVTGKVDVRNEVLTDLTAIAS